MVCSGSLVPRFANNVCITAEIIYNTVHACHEALTWSRGTGRLGRSHPSVNTNASSLPWHWESKGTIAVKSARVCGGVARPEKANAESGSGSREPPGSGGEAGNRGGDLLVGWRPQALVLRDWGDPSGPTATRSSTLLPSTRWLRRLNCYINSEQQV